jgi:hypothetical protein
MVGTHRRVLRAAPRAAGKATPRFRGIHGEVVAADLRVGHVINWGNGVHSRVLDASTDSGFILVRHQRVTAGVEWGRGMFFVLKPDQQVATVEESRP